MSIGIHPGRLEHNLIKVDYYYTGLSYSANPSLFGRPFMYHHQRHYWGQNQNDLFSNHLNQYNHPSLRLCVSRELRELAFINALQLWASKLRYNRIDRAIELVQCSSNIRKDALEDIGSCLLSCLVGKTLQVVAFEKGSSVVNTSSKIRNVDASERIRCPSVAANAKKLGIL
jgi:hypothetical protein